MIKKIHNVYKNKRRESFKQEEKCTYLYPVEKKSMYRKNKLMYAPNIFDTALN